MFAGQMEMTLFLVLLPQQRAVVVARTTAPPIHLEPTVALAAVDHIRLEAQPLRIPVAPEEAETLQVFLHHKAQTAAQEMALPQTLVAAAVAALLLLEMLDHQQLVAQVVPELRQLFLDHP